MADQEHSTPWDYWHEVLPSNWQEAVGHMAEQLYHWTPQCAAQAQKYDALITRLHELDIPLMGNAEDTVMNFVFDAGAVCAALGWALARTEPTRLEEYADWPARAVAYAGYRLLSRAEYFARNDDATGS